VIAVPLPWQAGDLPALIALLADDMVFALHVPADVLPIGGETRGKAGVEGVLQGLLDGYEFLAYEPSPLSGRRTRRERRSLSLSAESNRRSHRQPTTPPVVDR
jgi:hypothetical protein